MKKICIILCLLCFTSISYGQDNTKKENRKKLHYEVIAGGYYKNFLGKRYIEPTPGDLRDDFSVHQYERFTKMTAFGYQGGTLISYKIHNNWSVVSGLIYIIRKENFEGNYDSVIMYNAMPSYPYNNIHNVVEYEYSYDNIELPVLIQYEKEKFIFSLGIRLPLLSFYKATYTYLVSSSQIPYFSNTGPTSQKTIKNIENPLMIFPAFQMIYVVRIKEISLRPYLGIDIGTKKSFYLHGGIILPLNNFSLR